MTAFLMKLFIPGQEDPRDPRVRAACGRLSGIVGIICNLLLAAGKLAVGTLTASLAITADALNNFSDAASSIVTMIGFRLAEIPPDSNHPYGHARFEYLSGLAVSVIIIVMGFELIQASLSRIVHPSEISLSGIAILVLLLSIAVKLWLTAFNNKLSRTISSSALAATAADSRNDCIATGAVLVAALVQHLTGWRIDGFMGLAVALFILWSGWDLAKETISPLLGEAADPELRHLIVDYIAQNPKVLGYHDLMVHDYGPGQRFASIHVEMDHTEDPLVCHELIDDMERECMESHGIHLVIHYDPVITGDPALERMKGIVLGILQVRDPRLSIHDFRMVPGSDHTNLIFDISLPSDLLGQEDAIRKSLEKALLSLGEGTYYTIINFDPTAFN